MSEENKGLYVPDWNEPCQNCGQTPTVTMEKNGKQIEHWEMCGPCLWGESKMLDSDEWN